MDQVREIHARENEPDQLSRQAARISPKPRLAIASLSDKSASSFPHLLKETDDARCASVPRSFVLPVTCSRVGSEDRDGPWRHAHKTASRAAMNSTA